MPLIPTDRITNWTPGTYVGVPGGIKQYQPGGANQRTNLINVTSAPYNADPTGATDCYTAITAAIAAATTNDVVYLPAGTYRLDQNIVVSFNRNNITIRGAGPDVTTIDNRGNNAIAIGISSGIGPPNGATRSDCTVSAGLATGATTLTIGDASAFVVGDMIQIVGQNDLTLPVFSVSGGNLTNTNEQAGSWGQMAKLISKTANTLTFFPGLYHDYGGGSLLVEVWGVSNPFQVLGVGVEDLTIDTTNGSANGMTFDQCYGCWVDNVRSINANNYPLYIAHSMMIEVRHSTFSAISSGGSNGAGILLEQCYSSLIEDNIVFHTFPLLEVKNQCSGNVYAYNFTYDSVLGTGIDTNHGAHPCFNLYEGNISVNFKPDGYFGSCSDDTAFRNYFHADYGSTEAFLLKRFTRRYNLVGNLYTKVQYGYPNIGNNSFSGTASLINGDPWADWGLTGTLTTRTNNTDGTLTLGASGLDAGVAYTIDMRWPSGGPYSHDVRISVSGISGTVIAFTGATGENLPALNTVVDVYMGNSGYQEKDLDVEGTVIDKYNYNYDTSTMSGGGGDPLTDSLYTTRAEQEARGMVWGILTFPPFNPESPPAFNSSTEERIPAGYRYYNGDDPPTSGGVSFSGPGSTTFSGAGTVTFA